MFLCCFYFLLYFLFFFPFSYFFVWANIPSAQGVQELSDDRPRVVHSFVMYVPLGHVARHLVHEFPFVPDLKNPTEHCAHELSVADEHERTSCSPGPHVGLHERHWPPPAELLNEPGAHGWQLGLLVGVQSPVSSSPALHESRQSSHDVLLLVPNLNFPSWQPRQTLFVDDGQLPDKYVPGPH